MSAPAPAFLSWSMPKSVQQLHAQQPAVRFKPAWLFDFETGDFVRDGAGELVLADPQTAWEQSCVKRFLVQRGRWRAYSAQYGTDLRQALRQNGRARVRAYLLRAIRAGQLRDACTADVVDFGFDMAGDTLSVSFRVVPVYGEPADLSFVL